MVGLLLAPWHRLVLQLLDPRVAQVSDELGVLGRLLVRDERAVLLVVGGLDLLDYGLVRLAVLLGR